MIDFIKENKETLPYVKEDYLSFLNEEPTLRNWYGYSIQFDGLYTNKNKIQKLQSVLNHFINQFNEDQHWLIRHDDKFLPWFIEGDEKRLPKLKRVFNNKQVPFNFKGSILFSSDELLEVSDEVVSYSYLLSYKNLDIINVDTCILFKCTNHLTLDVISTEKILILSMRKYAEKLGYPVINYRNSPIV